MSDHGDHLTNKLGLSIDTPHNELTDFFQFANGNKLVFTTAFDPTFSQQAISIEWPKNFKLHINLDLNSEVQFGVDSNLDAVAGGYIPRPDKITKDIVLEVKFNKANQPVLKVFGKNLSKTRANLIKNNIEIFTGVRAEQFQFAPATRRNRPTIALQVDKSIIFGKDTDPTLLAWAQSIIDKNQVYIDSEGDSLVAKDGPYIDAAGRALRSQFPIDQRVINALDPSKHVANGFVYPDVVIYNTSKPAVFPNGRSLDDDVISYLENYPNTTPGPESDANTGVQTAVDAEYTTVPNLGTPPSATRADIRTWNTFPFHGLAYNIPTQAGNESIVRFYDTLTGSYYYTSDSDDIKLWDSKPYAVDQGVVFPASTSTGKAVYRFYDSENRTYFWTGSKNEYRTLKDGSQYTYQGETFFVQRPDSTTPGSTVVHRLYNSGSDRYFWSSNSSEISSFMASGYADQGVAWTV